jgi:hypothetical protein
MKRNVEAIGGKLWVQGNRQMTAFNRVPQGMASTSESAVLAAVAEAVSWRHALELDGPRKGQRIIIFPKNVPHLDDFLRSGDPNVHPEDGHPIACATILEQSQKFENPPMFWREDSEPITTDAVLSEKVPEMMAIAKQVATGNRKRVLEDGPDVLNSDDEEDPDMKPDVLSGMYTEGMDPKQGPIKLTQAQAAAQKAAAHAQKALKVPPRSQSPVYNSSDDDDPNGSQFIWSMSKQTFRRNKRWVDPYATKARPAPAVGAVEPTSGGARRNPVVVCSPDLQKSRLSQAPLALPAPERQPTPMSSDTEDQGFQSEDQKRVAKNAKKKAAAASQRAPAGSHPMATRTQEASRAGSLRSGGG